MNCFLDPRLQSPVLASLSSSSSTSSFIIEFLAVSDPPSPSSAATSPSASNQVHQHGLHDCRQDHDAIAAGGVRGDDDADDDDERRRDCEVGDDDDDNGEHHRPEHQQNHRHRCLFVVSIRHLYSNCCHRTIVPAQIIAAISFPRLFAARLPLSMSLPAPSPSTSPTIVVPTIVVIMFTNAVCLFTVFNARLFLTRKKLNGSPNLGTEWLFAKL